MNDVAQQLLDLETTDLASSEELAQATERVCRKLLRFLSRLVGRDGSYTLFRRSLKQVQTRFSLLQSVKTDPETNGLHGFCESLQHQEPAAAHAVCVAMIESLLDLFASFVGEDLTRKLMAQALIKTDEPEDNNTRDNS